MVAGNWLNYDGLYLQFGTQKAVPEAGGDYVVYGETREIEVLVNLGATVYGSPSGNVANPALPTLFNGVISTQTATSNTGIVSFTTLFPLQPTAPVAMATAGIYTASVGAANGILNILNPQMFIEQTEWVTLVPAAAGSGGGGATGITGIGLVTPIVPVATNLPSWVQITPNAGFQLLGLSAVNSNATPAITLAELTPSATVPAKWMWWPGIATQQFSVAVYADPTTATTTYPYGGNWMGNVPLTTLAEAYLPGALPNNAYISAIVSTSGTPGAAGTGFVGAGAGGLGKFRIRYNWYGTINDATQI